MTTRLLKRIKAFRKWNADLEKHHRDGIYTKHLNSGEV